MITRFCCSCHDLTILNSQLPWSGNVSLIRLEKGVGFEAHRFCIVLGTQALLARRRFLVLHCSCYMYPPSSCSLSSSLLFILFVALTYLLFPRSRFIPLSTSPYSPALTPVANLDLVISILVFLTESQSCSAPLL